MDYGIVVKILGKLLMLEAGLMTPALLVSLYNKEDDLRAFLLIIIGIFFLGFFLSRIRAREKNIGIREGLAIVTFGWLSLSLLGALPLYLGGYSSYVDAIFETVSGFTTTGATILDNVEELGRGVLFWRSFTHWIGGMGILVFTVSILPALGVGGFQIFKAESPGPVAGKIAPRIKDTAKILYGIYFSITILQVILLRLGGMDLFDSLVYTFGTVGTGGLATKSQSLGYYDSNYIHMVIGIFMVLSGVNFSLYYAIFKGRWREAIRDEEMRLYFLIIFIAVFSIMINLLRTSYNSIGLAFKDSFFQVGSIITTTGYSTTDFNLWPEFSKSILFTLMFIGGSAGSTAGGTKVIRLLVLLKLIKREILKLFHPKAIRPIKVNGEIMSDETLEGINAFISLYIIIFLLSGILISLEGVDMLTSFSSVAATLGNIGPGFNLVGPASSFSLYSPAAKLYFSLLMLLGRLELFTVIALFSPGRWAKSR